MDFIMLCVRWMWDGPARRGYANEAVGYLGLMSCLVLSRSVSLLYLYHTSLMNNEPTINNYKHVFVRTSRIV